MCCGRGYDTTLVKQITKCECKFKWCCSVECKDCEEAVDIHTCKAPKRAGLLDQTWRHIPHIPPPIMQPHPFIPLLEEHPPEPGILGCCLKKWSLHPHLHSSLHGFSTCLCEKKSTRIQYPIIWIYTHNPCVWTARFWTTGIQRWTVEPVTGDWAFVINFLCIFPEFAAFITHFTRTEP